MEYWRICTFWNSTKPEKEPYNKFKLKKKNCGNNNNNQIDSDRVHKQHKKTREPVFNFPQNYLQYKSELV